MSHPKGESLVQQSSFDRILTHNLLNYEVPFPKLFTGKFLPQL